MKAVYKNICIFLVLLAGLSGAVGAGANQELTDPQKLQRVYAMYEEYKEEFPQVRDISVTEAMQMIERGRKVVFVDTRSSEEMAVSMLPGAITKEDFLLADSTHYDDAVVIGYCTISYRSGLFAGDLAEQGRDISNLRGGMLAWVLEGGRVYDQDGVTKRIHTYGSEWEYGPRGYETIEFPFWKRILPLD